MYGRVTTYTTAGVLASLGTTALRFALPMTRGQGAAASGVSGMELLKESAAFGPAVYMTILGVSEGLLNQVRSQKRRNALGIRTKQKFSKQFVVSEIS